MTDDRNAPSRPEEAVPEGWVRDPDQAVLFACAVEVWRRRQDPPSPDEERCLQDAGMALIYATDALVLSLSGKRIPGEVLDSLIGVVMNVLLYVYLRGGGAEGLRAEDLRQAAVEIIQGMMDSPAS